MATIEYMVVVEPTESGYSAYAPDVLGCVAAAETETEVRVLIREALEFHLEGMQMHGEPIPKPAARVAYVEVTLPSAELQPCTSKHT